MRSLIIGAAGFVGPYLMRHLKIDLGHEVAVTKMKHEQIKTAGMESYDFEVYDVDILEQKEIKDLLYKVHPDYIFHLAAQSSVSVSWKNPGLTVDVNVNGAINVLEALRGLGYKPRMIMIGSGEEYGPVDCLEHGIQEDSRLNPANIYAATKACQNMIGRIYAEAYGLEVMMVRAFNHIGPDQEPIFAVADFCRQTALIEAGIKDAVIFVGNLKAERDFTDVRDVVRAYALLAKYGKSGETYNVGSGKAVSLSDILQMILSMSTTEIRVEVDPDRLRPIDVPIIQADISKMQTATNWKPMIRLEQTIKDTLDYWRIRGDGKC